MAPRTDELALPESTPNPSMLGAGYTNGNGASANGNGFNKLKLRVPMERRYVRSQLESAWLRR